MADGLHGCPPSRLQLPDRSGAPLIIRELSAHPPVPYPANRRDDESREALRRRIRGEFEDMPGLTITLPQAQRLFGLRADVCARVLNELTQQYFLARTVGGQVRRCAVV